DVDRVNNGGVACMLTVTTFRLRCMRPTGRHVMALLRHSLATLWRSDRVLTATGLLMLAALVPMLAGLFLDPRTITGAPAWLKPAKFAISTAIYSFTLAWFLAFLPSWPRLRAMASRGTAAVF